MPATVWHGDWVAHCQPVGAGHRALKYLASYIFRVAISNNRILKVTSGKVTFRYRVADTGQVKICTLKVEDFLRRFLQHVLPKGFVKVRYYGLFSPARRYLLPLLRLWLGSSESSKVVLANQVDSMVEQPAKTSILCPLCGQPMRFVQKIQPRLRSPP